MSGGRDLSIRIEEITRVEGHGDIVMDLESGEITTLELRIVESPRFFEAMLRGRGYMEAQHIMSRICGICAVSHSLASLKAVEAALGMEISEQARLLRRLAHCGEMLQSHLLHLCFLVLPDLEGEDSVIPLIEREPGLMKKALRLKALANSICEVVAGRHIHPISLQPGGVTHVPSARELERLGTELSGSIGELEELAGFFLGRCAPEFTRPREHISLKSPGGYGFYDGEPFSDRAGPLGVGTYTKHVKEYVVPYSTALQAATAGGDYMVGALSRVANGFDSLSAAARKAASEARLAPTVQGAPSAWNNPFANNLAQLVECFHFTDEAVAIIEGLLARGLEDEELARPTRWGTGVGVVEAPRGLLYHEYAVADGGTVESARCIIPTAQNLRSMEEDLRAFAPTIAGESEARIRLAVEALVRAYDPCISCATHLINVEFTGQGA